VSYVEKGDHRLQPEAVVSVPCREADARAVITGPWRSAKQTVCGSARGGLMGIGRGCPSGLRPSGCAEAVSGDRPKAD
jgi:hypothetical protein